MDNHKTPIWEARNICKAFPGVQALDNVSITLLAGEVHALVGENGCGKSTLAKCFAGAHTAESGQLLHEGRVVVFRHPMEARAEGIATIYQEFSLVPTMSVVENIFLGRYRQKPGTRVIDWERMRQETLHVLDELSISLDPDAIVGSLSVAEQQLVEIAKAISVDSSLLIMDEPTAALGIIETERLLNLIRHLAAQNKAIIYISHRLDEIFEVADRVTILKDGRLVHSGLVSELHMSDVIRMMIGLDIKQHYPKERNVQPTPCLEVENLTTEQGVDDVTFTVNTGEVLGLGGMLGSGRTEIARAIFGVDPIKKGTVRLYGREVHFNSPVDAIASGVGLIPENRKMDGLFFNFEASKNITITRLAALLSGPLLSLSRETGIGQQYIRKMNITPTALEKSVQFLSGGNQQKVIISRWLFSQARLLILDEPTQGIDVGAKQEVYKVINELTRQGISIILISADYPELLAMSDRVAVVRDGHIRYVAEGQRLSQYQLTALASGVGLSREIETWMELRRLSYPLMQALRNRLKLTVHLTTLDRQDMQVFYLEKVGAEGEADMRSRSGSTGPMSCSGVGKVLLAYAPAELVEDWLAKEDLVRFTEHSITDRAVFMAELETIRAQGFGVDREEQELGIHCIALPVFAADGTVIAAVSVSGPSSRMAPDQAQHEIRKELSELAAQIAQRIATIDEKVSLETQSAR